MQFKKCIFCAKAKTEEICNDIDKNAGKKSPRMEKSTSIATSKGKVNLEPFALRAILHKVFFQKTF